MNCDKCNKHFFQGLNSIQYINIFNKELPGLHWGQISILVLLYTFGELDSLGLITQLETIESDTLKAYLSKTKKAGLINKDETTNKFYLTDIANEKILKINSINNKRYKTRPQNYLRTTNKKLEYKKLLSK